MRTSKADVKKGNEEKGKLISKEDRNTGEISSNVYISYAREGGYVLCLAVLVFSAMLSVSQVLASILFNLFSNFLKFSLTQLLTGLFRFGLKIKRTNHKHFTSQFMAVLLGLSYFCVF